MWRCLPPHRDGRTHTRGHSAVHAIGTVPRENHAASPVFARGFVSRESRLDGTELLATGSDDEWPHSAARLNAGLAGHELATEPDPTSLGFAEPNFALPQSRSGRQTPSIWLRAFIDASRRLFSSGAEPVAQTPTFEEISLPAGAIPIAVAVVIRRATSGDCPFSRRRIFVTRALSGLLHLLRRLFRSLCCQPRGC